MILRVRFPFWAQQINDLPVLSCDSTGLLFTESATELHKNYTVFPVRIMIANLFARFPTCKAQLLSSISMAASA